MKKTFMPPTINIIKFESGIIATSCPLPSSKWSEDENGYIINPAGHIVPGHNKNHEEIWG